MNQLINFFWTIVCFIPIVNYWSLPGNLPWHFPFLVLSLLSLFFPARLLQLSKHLGFYEGLGVKLVRKFVQGGDYASRLIRKKNPNYRQLKKTNPAQYLKTVLMYEQFHFAGFIFFLGTTIHAVINSNFIMAAWLMIANIVYNVFPILLQQYNRARLMKIGRQP